MRAAASSIARGRPSRRTQISATAAASSSVSSNPDARRAPARRTGGPPPRRATASAEATSSGRVQRRHGDKPLAADPQRLPAGHEDPKARARSQQVGDPAGGVDHLLEVVEHQEHAPRREVRHAGDRAVRRLPDAPTARAIDVERRIGVASPARGRRSRRRRSRGRPARRPPDRQPRLADAARADQGQQAHGRVGEHVSDLARAPARVRRARTSAWAGSWGGPSSVISGGNPAASAGCITWKIRSGCRQVLQPMVPEIGQRHLRRQSTLGELGGARRDQHLPAVAGRADPRGAMHVEPRRRTRRRSDPHPCGAPYARGSGRRQATDAVRARAVPRPRRATRRARREDGEERVTFGADDQTVVRLDRRAHDVVMLLQQRWVAVAQALDEPRAPLDVGEQERDGPGGVVTERGHAPIMTQAKHLALSHASVRVRLHPCRGPRARAIPLRSPG